MWVQYTLGTTLGLFGALVEWRVDLLAPILIALMLGVVAWSMPRPRRAGRPLPVLGAVVPVLTFLIAGGAGGGFAFWAYLAALVLLGMGAVMFLARPGGASVGPNPARGGAGEGIAIAGLTIVILGVLPGAFILAVYDPALDEMGLGGFFVSVFVFLGLLPWRTLGLVLALVGHGLAAATRNRRVLTKAALAYAMVGLLCAAVPFAPVGRAPSEIKAFFPTWFILPSLLVLALGLGVAIAIRQMRPAVQPESPKNAK